jgi:hypothetical protein
MKPIVLTAEVDNTRAITIHLPDDVPTGKVEITVRPLADDALGPPPEPMTREWARAKLKVAGLLAEEDFPEAEELSEEEEERLGRLLAGPCPVEDYINEDREERF